MLYPASDIDWRFNSYMIVYMLQFHSPKSSHRLPLPLPLSPKVRYTHLCLVSCLAGFYFLIFYHLFLLFHFKFRYSLPVVFLILISLQVFSFLVFCILLVRYFPYVQCGRVIFAQKDSDCLAYHLELINYS